MKLEERTEGDIDTLFACIAHIRTSAFVANRSGWLNDHDHWQGVARHIEDRLSDALHERLAHRFADRRMCVLMRRLREKNMLEAELTTDDGVLVEGQHVGRLEGFRFIPDTSGEVADGQALRIAAQNVLTRELERRAERLSDAPDTDIVVSTDGILRWLGQPVGHLGAGEQPLNPQIRLLSDDALSVPAREKAELRLKLWINGQIEKLLPPLKALEKAEDLNGLARSVANRLVDAWGVLERFQVANDMKALDQEQRTQLRKYGVRFGAYHIYLPLLLKPAPRSLAAQLWSLAHGVPEADGVGDVQALAGSGRTSFAADAQVPKDYYRVLGYRVCGERAVRVDILERMADIIRPAIAYRPGITEGSVPEGAAEGNGFTVTISMTSLVGCAGEDFSKILHSLGYKMETKPAPVAPDSESSSEQIQADNPEAAAAVEEPVVIEIWRPARQEHARPAHRRQEKPQANAPQGPRRAAQTRAEGFSGSSNRSDGHNRDGKPRHEARPEREQGDRRKPNRGSHDHGGKLRGPDKAPDPNSPFAALLALKEKLQQAPDGGK
jgi:ATP-dependent RNA helicase SUPV3L1/SUV3